MSLQLPERKGQLDRIYKMILADVENHRRLVNELTDKVANLEALVVTTQMSLLRVLQCGYDEHQIFFGSHQEREKWLLNMSYKLMAHNSLNTSTYGNDFYDRLINMNSF
ncbi:hypothetical protein Btru_056908 [Bulinus truncatus]|nr:hypothetical protein Btru_056908 [Bulinus truncatus]